jgi:hypothetical protein
VFDPLKESLEEDNYINVPYELAHNIIFAGIEFAEQYGFAPHRDFTNITSFLLEEDDDEVPFIDVEVGGDDGKPLYVNNGYDSPVRERQVVAQLAKTAGLGNYHILLKVDKDKIEQDNERDLEMDEIYEQMKRLSKDEQKQLYLDLQEKTPTEETAKQFFVLSDLLSQDFLSDELVDEQFDKIDKYLIEGRFVKHNNLPNSLFEGATSADYDDIVEAFDKLDNSNKSLKSFQKKYGELPIAAYLGLNADSKEYIKELEVCRQKYPDYFLIRMTWLIKHLTLVDKEEKESVAKEIVSLAVEHPGTLTDWEIGEFVAVYFFAYIGIDRSSLENLAFVTAMIKYCEEIQTELSIDDDFFITLMEFKDILLTKLLREESGDFSAKKI